MVTRQSFAASQTSLTVSHGSQTPLTVSTASSYYVAITDPAWPARPVMTGFHCLGRKRTKKTMRRFLLLLLLTKGAALAINRVTLRRVNTRLDASPSIISNQWYVWSALSIAGSLGVNLERTKMGSALSPPIITMASTLLACNTGLLPVSHNVYKIVSSYLIPLSVPLLLFDANLNVIFKTTGSLLKAFLCGTIGTFIGSLVAYIMVPLKNIAGSDKIVAALCARHIGGAINFVAICDVLNAPSNLVAAALAADNVIVALYFLFLFAVAAPSKDDFEVTKNLKMVKTEVCPLKTAGIISSSTNDDEKVVTIDPSITGAETYGTSKSTAAASDHVSIASITSSLSVAFVVVAISEIFQQFYGMNTILSASLITVLLATVFPTHIGSLSKSGSAIGTVFMQLFFAVTGAQGHITTVLKVAPGIFVHSFIQVAIHFLVAVQLGKLFKLPFREIVLSSNANVGGPTTASAMASSKRWKSLIVPALLTGVFGYAIATVVGLCLFKILPLIKAF